MMNDPCSEHGTVQLFLGRIDGKLDMVLENQREQAERLQALEGRISILENHRNYALGIIGAVSIIWILAFDWLKGKLFS